MLLPVLFLAMVTSVDSSAVDSLKSVDAQCVTVYADDCRCSADERTSAATRSIDQLMEQATVSLTRRAALASEPSIRGLHGGQLAMSVDGMKIHAACVDHMDPATAYVELSALDRLDVHTGADDFRYGSNLGGSLTFGLRKPEFTTPFTGAATVSGESNSMARTASLSLNAASEQSAARASYTYRSAQDFVAGGARTVTGSNYEKHNLSAAVTWRLAPSQSLTVDGVADLATFIGFPALVMDTRRATGLIGAVTWKGALAKVWKTSLKLYSNYVDHVMDDYARPEEQVRSRAFMPNMHMPMTGISKTLGFLAETHGVIAGGAASVVVDASWLQARADMDMYPLDTTVLPMHMINVGDASIGDVGVVAGYDIDLSSITTFSAQARMDVSPRGLRDPTSQSIFEGYLPNATFNTTMFASSGSIALGLALSDAVSTRFILSTSQRLPTHLEQYGFYIYDPQSMYITIGNPNLHAERSWNAELGSTFRISNVSVRASVYGQHITDYIAPDPSQQIVNGTSPPERIYGNIGTALIAGVDLGGEMRFSDLVSMDALVGYTYGYLQDAADPLPLTPPLHYRLHCTVGTDVVLGELSVVGAAAQANISTSVRPENTTAAWCIANATISWQVHQHIRLGASVLNVLDTFYHEHQSINDMPSPGRSLRIVVGTRW